MRKRVWGWLSLVMVVSALGVSTETFACSSCDSDCHAGWCGCSAWHDTYNCTAPDEDGCKDCEVCCDAYDCCGSGESGACWTAHECPGGGGSCFLAGTKITMADGSKKPIEDVKVGELVRSFDANGQLTMYRVLGLEAPIREGYYELTLVNGTVLEVTNEHPLFMKTRDGSYTGWGSLEPTATEREAHLKTVAIHPGDALKTEGGQWVVIQSLRYISGQVQTYNLKQIEGSSTFFANGIYVHNKGGCPGVSCVSPDVSTCFPSDCNCVVKP